MVLVGTGMAAYSTSVYQNHSIVNQNHSIAIFIFNLLIFSTQQSTKILQSTRYH